MSAPEAETPPITRRSVAEIVAGYVLILAIVAGLFGLAGGIDIAMPWGVMAAIAALGAALAYAARRRL